MERQTFEDAADWLQKYHQCPISKEARDQYFGSLKDYGDVEFSDGVNLWCERAQPLPSRFPAVMDLKRCVQELRDSQWEKVKKSTPTRQMFLDGIQGDGQYQRDSIRVIKKIIANGPSQRYFSEMEGKYPRASWKECGDMMRAWKAGMEKYPEQSPERSKFIKAWDMHYLDWCNQNK